MIAEAMGKNDWATVGALKPAAATSDVFITSACGVSESGDLVFADLTGNRVAGVAASKHVIVVVGANKIVPTADDAIKRLHNFALPAESARVRVAYKVPASSVNNELIIRGGNPFDQPGRIHLIIIKGKSYGF